MPGDQVDWAAAAQAVETRALATAASLTAGFPHWADVRTGAWTTTPDGDWTGGAFPGQLWLAHHARGDQKSGALAQQWSRRLRPRAALRTAFKGFGFYYGAALGDILAGDAEAGELAMQAARSLVSLFDPALGLIPLGSDAEEASDVGGAFSSIDSLQATPLLQWAARRTGEAEFAECAARHTTRVLDIHCRADGGIIQSSELAADGAVRRQFTHKGVSDHSIWGRAQGWGVLYATMGYARERDPHWLAHAMRSADWWLANVPPGMVSYWDFDDPAIPDTEYDTAATAIVANALLKLGAVAPEADRARYHDAGVRTVGALVRRHLTPVGADDTRPAGMLVDGCFTKRPGSRSSDSVTRAELVFGTYFLLESLEILRGTIAATTI